MHRIVKIVIAAALLAGGSASAADPVRHQAVSLAPGAPLTKLGGSIKGYGSVEYLLTVPAGGALRLKLRSANLSANFNVARQGEQEALFVGSRDGDQFDVTAPAGAVYKVNVYLMRNAARRNEQARYTLEASAAAAPEH